MTSSDVDDVARLINQLHPDQPGVIRPERVLQGWRAFVARNDEGGAVGFLLGRSSTTGWLTKARERLSSSSLTSRCAASRLARSWSNAGSRGSLPKEYHSGSRARDRTPSASTNNAVSRRCTGPWLVWAAEGDRSRPQTPLAARRTPYVNFRSLRLAGARPTIGPQLRRPAR